ncbi:LysR substrate-binding domain-containing protein [Paenibacillus sp. y28]|uniref:LysR substrate-binding domain-containing protein n=1 Tax=Paenibacillus sp. y28 TaxID=3129110 RepID=UPI003019A82D
MNVNLLKLEIVELLEKHKKITAVAELLELKQPTISFHMKSLEQELGVQLFEFRAGKTQLTEAGMAFHHYAVKINALSREAERVVKEFQGPGKGALLIGASYVPGTYILPDVISGFAKAFPKLSITVSVKPAPVIKEQLLNHDIDIGIFSSEPFQLEPLCVEPLGADELVVIFSPGHRFAGLPELTAGHLAEEPFIVHRPESNTRALTVNWAEANGVVLNALMELDSIEAIKQIVMAGSGVSFVSRLSVEREARRGELLYRPIPRDQMARSVFYAYNRDRRQSAVLKAFVQVLNKHSTPAGAE